RLVTHRVGTEPARLARALRGLLLERALKLGELAARSEGPDDVVVVHGRPGRGTALGDRDEAPLARGEPQHEVGEGQVGDELPVTGEAVQPLDVGGVEVAVALDEVGEGGHAASLGARGGRGATVSVQDASERLSGAAVSRLVLPGRAGHTGEPPTPGVKEEPRATSGRPALPGRARARRRDARGPRVLPSRDPRLERTA